MKIGQKKPTLPGRSNWAWLVGLFVTFIVGFVLGGKDLWRMGEQFRQIGLSFFSSVEDGENLPTLFIDMPFSNYNAILDQRAEALAASVFIASEADFQTAEIRLDNHTVPVRLRLQQGTAVHLGENEKWNFDVRTRNDQQIIGMQRFYLIDPADNNWIYEWAFLQTLRNEGVLAPNYEFMQLVLNGDAKGIYVLQEGFGAEIMLANGRQEGVIVEFDAARLWESVAYAGGDNSFVTADPIANLTAADFRFFEVDTFRDASIAQNDSLSAQKDTAIGLLRGVQNGSLAAADVFDVALYGRFLAAVDFWGATRATTLTNLRYYYNPQTGRLEPIGFNGAPNPDAVQRLRLNAAYGDPLLLKAYTEAVWRMSQPEYLVQLQASLESAAQAQKFSLPEEFAEISWQKLQQRQEKIRRSLTPVQPVFAYWGSPAMAKEGFSQIDVANVLNLPVELLGLDLDGAAFLELDPAWIQNNANAWFVENETVILMPVAEGDTAVLQYLQLQIPLVNISRQDNELDLQKEPDIQLFTRIWGLETNQQTTIRPGYPAPILIPTDESQSENE